MDESLNPGEKTDKDVSPEEGTGGERRASSDLAESTPGSRDWDPFRDDSHERDDPHGPGESSRDPGAPSREPEAEPEADDAASPRGRAESPGPALNLASREAHVGHLDSTDESIHEAIGYLLEHRRRRRGRIIGIAGLPRHGKSAFAERLRVKSARRPGTDLRYYNKTRRGEVKMYYIPGRTEHHVLVDMAGEDFQSLGDYASEVPGLMREFLWPILQNADGLILMMALPIVWAPWNPVDAASRPHPTAEDMRAMRREVDRMVNAHIMLLKYALVAENLEKLRKKLPELGLNQDQVPTRNQVDDAFRSAGRLRAPIALGFSKADLYRSHGPRKMLYTPDIPASAAAAPPPLHPAATDPMMLGWMHFPRLFDFLMKHVRHFKFDFVQVLEDPSDDPFESSAADADIETMIGAEGLLEFVTAHAWSVPGISTATAVRLDQLLRRNHWREDALAALRGVVAP